MATEFKSTLEMTSALRAILRDLFGKDIDLTLVKHGSWGDDAVCFFVFGNKHKEAAIAMAETVIGSSVECLRSNNSHGRNHDYSAVEMPLAPESAA